MKKQYFIYILLCAYSCSAFGVKPELQHKQMHQKVKNHNSQATEAATDTIDENNVDAEVPKKPTYMDTWKKVITLNLKSLSRDDAWNIAATVTSAGALALAFKFHGYLAEERIKEQLRWLKNEEENLIKNIAESKKRAKLSEEMLENQKKIIKNFEIKIEAEKAKIAEIRARGF